MGFTATSRASPGIVTEPRAAGSAEGLQRQRLTGFLQRDRQITEVIGQTPQGVDEGRSHGLDRLTRAHIGRDRRAHDDHRPHERDLERIRLALGGQRVERSACLGVPEQPPQEALVVRLHRGAQDGRVVVELEVERGQTRRTKPGRARGRPAKAGREAEGQTLVGTDLDDPSAALEGSAGAGTALGVPQRKPHHRRRNATPRHVARTGHLPRERPESHVTGSAVRTRALDRRHDGGQDEYGEDAGDGDPEHVRGCIIERPTA